MDSKDETANAVNSFNGINAPMGSHISAKRQLDALIEHTEGRVRELKELRDSIWWEKLTPEAEQCLWGMFINARW